MVCDHHVESWPDCNDYYDDHGDQSVFVFLKICLVLGNFHANLFPKIIRHISVNDEFYPITNRNKLVYFQETSLFPIVPNPSKVVLAN